MFEAFHILVIDYSVGPSVYVSWDKELLDEILLDWALFWWPQEFLEEEQPSKEDIVQQYFSRNENESYSFHRGEIVTLGNLWRMTYLTEQPM